MKSEVLSDITQPLYLVCNKLKTGKVKGILQYDKTNCKGGFKPGILTSGFKTLELGPQVL